MGICSYNLVYNFTIQLIAIQLLPLKSLVFVVHFLNAFWHGNETFPKGSSQNEIVPLLVVFHLPYSKYNGVKICFYSCGHQNQNFSLVSHSCLSCSTRVVRGALVLHLCRTYVARVSLVSLVSHSCCICVTLVALVFLVSGTRVVNQTRSSHIISLFTQENQISLFTEAFEKRFDKINGLKVTAEFKMKIGLSYIMKQFRNMIYIQKKSRQG